MLTNQEEASELPHLAMYSILKAVKATGDTCMEKQDFEDAALHYTRALEWGMKSGHLTDAKAAALHLARSNAYLSSGECTGESLRRVWPLESETAFPQERQTRHKRTLSMPSGCARYARR